MTKAVEDLPGLGQYYCVECAKYFDTEVNRAAHLRGKNHKRRTRLLREKPYSQREAEEAAGLGLDNGRKQHDEADAARMQVDSTT